MGPDKLHGVVDGQPGADDAPGAVDIHADILIRVLPVQIEELGNNQIGYLVIDGQAQKNNPLL